MATTTCDIEERKKQLRQAFGSFTTGVTVVTTKTADGSPLGFTANSFSSVSLDPPMLLICLAKTSSHYENFTKSQTFAVNILGDAQKDVSSRFASRVEDRFAETDWHESVGGNPLTDGAIAWFDCTNQTVVEAGDHAILIGRIDDFGYNDKRPLAYLRGHYLDLGLVETAADSVSQQGGIRVGCVLHSLGNVLLRKSSDGWTLPMGTVGSGFREARVSLDKSLAKEGIDAELGFLYSVFDAPTGNATWMVFQGEVEVPPTSDDYKLFPLDALPLEDIAIREIGSVLRRFRSEFKESRFGLYVDDPASSGKISPIKRSSANWPDSIGEQV